MTHDDWLSRVPTEALIAELEERGFQRVSSTVFLRLETGETYQLKPRGKGARRDDD